jgi:hypothetical protein
VEARLDAGTRPLVRYRRTKEKPVLDRGGNQAFGQTFAGVRALKRVPVVVPPPAPPPPPPNPTAPPDLDPDRDGYTAPLDCKPSDPGTHPGAEDAPDFGFADTNCDGIDGTEAKAVFVSPRGNDANPGTKDKPKRQIHVAVTAAAMTGRYVLAATGSYGGIVAATGVDIYGGYDQQSWSRPSEGETEIVGSPEGVLAVGVQNVTLQLLSIRGVHGGGSAYGIRAINGSSLRVQRVGVTAGSGAAGATGATGAAGRPGGDGQPGAKGACDSDVEAPGGEGGESFVGRYGGKGGDGKYEGDGGAGAAGVVGTPGGKGGAEHGNEYTIHSGEYGSNGSNGTPGASGPGGTSTTALATAVWRGQDGREGIYGGPGNGGPGGGGGGGAGGPSIGIFKLGTATAKLTNTRVAFGTGGAAGAGGGTPGQAGISQAAYPS